MDNSELMTVAKSAIETGISSLSRQAVLAKIDAIATERRQPNQSHAQAYAKFLETPDGQLLYRFSKVARVADESEGALIRKALHDDLTIDTVSKRMARQAIALQESAPYLSDRECAERVLAANPGARELMAKEMGQPIAKSKPGTAVHQLTRAADTMVARHKGISGHDEAYARIALLVFTRRRLPNWMMLTK